MSGCGISGVISQIYRQDIKQTTQRQTARQWGEPCCPGPPSCRSLYHSHRNVLLLPCSLTLHLRHPLSLHSNSFSLSSPSNPLNPLFHIHTPFPAPCMLPEESGNQWQWSALAQEQCARGCFGRLSKKIGGTPLSLTSTVERKDLP